MGFESFPRTEWPRVRGRAAGKMGRLIPGALSLCGSLAIGVLPGTTLRADSPSNPPSNYPSKVILGLRATCMSTCQEKEDARSCNRYCDCHLFELRRDLSDSQVEQLLLTAERGGTGAESIRRWLHSSALLCEKRVFGDGPGEK